jgi:hypothetical protein
MIEFIAATAAPLQVGSDERGGTPQEVNAMASQPKTDSRTYFKQRERQELEMAATCENNAAALAHLTLAEEYRKRVVASDTVAEPG